MQIILKRSTLAPCTAPPSPVNQERPLHDDRVLVYFHRCFPPLYFNALVRPRTFYPMIEWSSHTCGFVDKLAYGSKRLILSACTIIPVHQASNIVMHRGGHAERLTFTTNYSSPFGRMVPNYLRPAFWDTNMMGEFINIPLHCWDMGA